MNSSPLAYEFGGFLLDTGERVLRRGDAAVPLTPKSTEVLLVLVERRGHLVEKADLMRQVWPDTAVEESNLTQNIYTLRKVLGDADRSGPFIETVPRRGYRFVAPVREVYECAGAVAPAEPAGLVPAAAESAAPDGSGVLDPALDVASAPPNLEPSRHWRWRRYGFPWVLPALAVALVGTGAVWLSPDRPSLAERTPELAPRLSRLTHVGTVVRAAISPDGRSLAYATSNGARESLWMKAIGSPSPIQLIEPAVGTYRRGGGLSYAPSGWVYYTWFRPDLAPVGVYRIPQHGGQPERLANLWDLPSFDRGGDRFACITTTSSSIRDSRLLVYDAEGQSPRVVAMRAPPMTFLQMRPAWAPDGRRLAAWTMSSRAPGLRDLVTVELAGQRERIVTSLKLHSVDGMVWLPDGASVIVGARERASSPLRLWQVPLAAPALHPLTTDTSDYLLSGLTDDGRLLAAVRVEVARSLWVGPSADLSRARQVASDAGELSELESIGWMPDGRVLYTSAESGNADIWIFDPVQNTSRQLTSSPADDFNPASSPDGRTIVFASNRSGASGLWTMTDAGEASIRQLTNGGDSRPVVTSDGWVVFQRGVIQSAPITLWRIPLKGGAAAQITEGTSIRPAVSPDGTLVAHYRLTPERWTLAVGPMHGVRPEQLFPLSSTHCGRTVRWSPDGKALAYIDCEGGVGNIWVRGLDGRPPRRLTSFTSGQIETFDWSPDGSQLAWITRQQVSDAVSIDLSGRAVPPARAPAGSR